MTESGRDKVSWTLVFGIVAAAGVAVAGALMTWLDLRAAAFTFGGSRPLTTVPGRDVSPEGLVVLTLAAAAALVSVLLLRRSRVWAVGLGLAGLGIVGAAAVVLAQPESAYIDVLARDAVAGAVTPTVIREVANAALDEGRLVVDAAFGLYASLSSGILVVLMAVLSFFGKNAGARPEQPVASETGYDPEITDQALGTVDGPQAASDDHAFSSVEA